MDGTEKDTHIITADTLSLTKIGIPASFAAMLATIAVAADQGNLANQPPHFTIAVFALTAIGLICATAVAVTDYIVRYRLTIAKAAATSTPPASTTETQPAAYLLMVPGGKPVVGKGKVVQGTALPSSLQIPANGK